jgi:hypothetical protein
MAGTDVPLHALSVPEHARAQANRGPSLQLLKGQQYRFIGSDRPDDGASHGRRRAGGRAGAFRPRYKSGEEFPKLIHG